MDQATARRLRMVAHLTNAGVLTTPSVEEAMRTVPRHLFIPAVDGPDAYADEAVTVKYAANGSPISSASQPTMVAIMLERLGVVPGQRVLEVGTGTGYNAALLSVLVGVTGSVVSVELEPDLARRASEVLDTVVEGRVEVVVGDGREGYPPLAPYDRVIVTAGARDLAAAWKAQLADGGRLVVPIVDRHGIGSVVVFDDVEGHLVRGAGTPCGFVPIRPVPSQ